MSERLPTEFDCANLALKYCDRVGQEQHHVSALPHSRNDEFEVNCANEFGRQPFLQKLDLFDPVAALL
jgi:hypothetical protein